MQSLWLRTTDVWVAFQSVENPGGQLSGFHKQLTITQEMSFRSEQEDLPSHQSTSRPLSERTSPSSYKTWTVAKIMAELQRKDILEGKDINLVSLLISSKDGMENKAFSCDQVSVVLKARDPRLSKKLSIAEFVLAFSIFRDVICSQHPSRREELDLYLYRVVELGYRYGGSAFYDYHRSFSAKAAAAWAQFNYLADWSQLDTELFCQHFAGLRAPVCSVCQATDHTSGFCPNSSTNEPSTSQAKAQALSQSPPRPSRKITDRLGRPIIYVGKDQICNNYNYTGCVFSACRLLHLCVFHNLHPTADAMPTPAPAFQVMMLD
ncbi:uncharacterized protein WCC33_000014 [Rhinophrynus dorsalis]